MDPLDEEILDYDRGEETAQMADKAIFDLDMDRQSEADHAMADIERRLADLEREGKLIRFPRKED